MKKRLLVSVITTTLAIGFLGACGVDNNRMTNDDRDNNFTPVRYDRNDLFDNDNTLRRDNFDPVRYDNDFDRGILNDDNRIFNDENRNDRRFNGYDKRNGNDTRSNMMRSGHQ